MARQWARLPSFFSAIDEEMGKKDDDRKLSSRGTWAPSSRITPRPTAARRLVPLLLLAAILYICIGRLRSGGNPIPGEYDPIFPKYEGASGSPAGGSGSNLYPPSRSPSRPPTQEKPASIPGQPPPRTFNGDFTLLPLAATLRQISSTAGVRKDNRNVLFASSSARSTATLLPLACEMARERRNYVHYAILSRHENPIKETLRLNGVDDSCGIIFHGRVPCPTISKFEANNRTSNRCSAQSCC